MTQGERVRSIRKELNLTLEKFGKKLDVKKSAISDIESGRNSLTAQMFNAICREYRVNPNYLDGTDENPNHKFLEVPQTVLDELCEQYKCDALDRSIIQEYLELDDDDRKVVKEYIKKIAMRIATNDMTKLMPDEPDQFKNEKAPEEAELKKKAE